ncbi:MAG TPA: hypothetical protein VGB50_02780 [Flavobacterium sp.]|jgi:hypothetical protein
MNLKRLVIVFVINAVISFGYYFQNRDADVTEISSDLANIIPICKKLDDPSLFKQDLFLNDINDVKYYTPFYVQSLRFFAFFTQGDYLQALNLLSLFTHLIYGLSWFFLFYAIGKDFLLALLFSVFFRGILWPPGGELLGISDLWTIMPRTVFTAIAPLPFLIFRLSSKYNLALAAFVLGIISNFHPISGVGAIVIYFSAYIVNAHFTGSLLDRKFIRKLILAMACCIAGLLPYLITYVLHIKVEPQFSDELYNQAFRRRISDIFVQPLQFILSWKRPILVFFLVPFVVYYFFDTSRHKRNFKILFTAILILFLTANSLVYIENAVNGLFEKKLRMSFQLIRYQKFLLVLLQVATFLLICELCAKFKIGAKAKIGALALFFILAFFSSHPVFSRLPLVGDDMMTSILPDAFKFYNAPGEDPQEGLAEIISDAKTLTPKDAVFYGSYLVRSGADRSVVLDSKGAGMLIEGNMNKFVQWYLDEKQFKSLEAAPKIDFLRSKNVDYVIVDTVWSGQAMIKSRGKYKLYKISQ